MSLYRRSIYGRAFGYGILGAFIMTVLLALLRWSGMSQFNFSMLLGSMLTQEFTPSSFAVGFMWHLLNGGVFGLIYAAIFKGTGGASAGKGTVIGFIHWLFFSAVMALLPSVHPLAPGELYPPGFFALNYGLPTALAGLGAHLVFGYVVGNALEGSIVERRRAGRTNRKLERAGGGYPRRV